MLPYLKKVCDASAQCVQTRAGFDFRAQSAGMIRCVSAGLPDALSCAYLNRCNSVQYGGGVQTRSIRPSTKYANCPVVVGVCR